MNELDVTLVAADEVLVTVFGRLFESEFATLDGISMSRLTPDGLRYLDQSVALSRLLGEESAGEPFVPADRAILALHGALYAAAPEVDTVVSGWARHLQALLLEGLALPMPTSMMRKRGIPDLGPHVVAPGALLDQRQAGSIATARELAIRNDMKHLLLLGPDGFVVAAGTGTWEVMAHWHNVEFAAHVECLRVEEAEVLAAGASRLGEGPGHV
jgi:ribulose-5-phosphate 4-epimerase/fuculose-1-phosphate aldolase